MSRAWRRAAVTAVTAVLLTAACSDDPEPEPEPVVEPDPADLLDAAEVLDEVTVELVGAADDTAVVTVRNDRADGGIAVLEPVVGLRVEVEGADGRTDLYVRPLDDEESRMDEEPKRHDGFTVAAGESLELDRTLLVPAEGTLTVCIETKTFPADRPSGETSDFPGRRPSDPIVVICSEPTELGDA